MGQAGIWHMLAWHLAWRGVDVKTMNGTGQWGVWLAGSEKGDGGGGGGRDIYLSIFAMEKHSSPLSIIFIPYSIIIYNVHLLLLSILLPTYHYFKNSFLPGVCVVVYIILNRYIGSSWRHCAFGGLRAYACTYMINNGRRERTGATKPYRAIMAQQAWAWYHHLSISYRRHRYHQINNNMYVSSSW